MLVQLFIQDIVLIDHLDIEFNSSLSVLTGETGAGKSILLDSLSLALGGRGDGSLVRMGASSGQVRAVFSLPTDHEALEKLQTLVSNSNNNTVQAGEHVEIVLRRVQSSDGRTHNPISMMFQSRFPNCEKLVKCLWKYMDNMMIGHWLMRIYTECLSMNAEA